MPPHFKRLHYFSFIPKAYSGKSYSHSARDGGMVLKQQMDHQPHLTMIQKACALRFNAQALNLIHVS